MRTIHEKPEVIRSAIQASGGVQIHPIVAPAETSWKIGHRHDFQQGDAEIRQMRQLLSRSRPRTFGSEGADMHFVHHLAFARYALPCLIRPWKDIGIDNERRSMGTLGLEA